MIINADCLEELDKLKENSVDMLIIDPPYFIPAETYKTLTKYGKRMSELAMMEGFFKNLFKKLDRVIKKEGHLLIFCDCNSYPLFYIHLFPYVKKMRSFVWDKISCSLGYGFRHQHELILYGQRPNHKSIKCGLGDVLKFKAVKANTKIHPSQKPVDLYEHLIKNLSSSGDTILDCFCGVASSGVGCKKVGGRNWLGIEIDTHYCDLGRKRLL